MAMYIPGGSRQDLLVQDTGINGVSTKMPEYIEERGKEEGTVVEEGGRKE
ncbi:2611_t:CDS:2, partial [Funneliformis geosporum]